MLSWLSLGPLAEFDRLARRLTKTQVRKAPNLFLAIQLGLGIIPICLVAMGNLRKPYLPNRIWLEAGPEQIVAMGKINTRLVFSTKCFPKIDKFDRRTQISRIV